MDWCIDSTRQAWKSMVKLNEYLLLIKANNNLNVQRVMIDCSNTEISGFRSIFNDGTKGDDKYETRQLLDATRIKLNDMMHAVLNLLLVQHWQDEIMTQSFLIFYDNTSN
ncbi:uncharacterized protein BX664DRAFT_360479 [Halteromyces radiatus]|uniref:uncharacterized protein n=1 Tax=Halteromyces radiatus TaxID=101107 RepID=UPI00221E880C|nr:uncharacterized protein BX664DRAFT_360479 [Halteromyces radiatus]KAI8084638.1 hypothetical protein BX664DRAFT_360479 [Halteromyces radiatus]